MNEELRQKILDGSKRLTEMADLLDLSQENRDKMEATLETLLKRETSGLPDPKLPAGCSYPKCGCLDGFCQAPGAGDDKPKLPSMHWVLQHNMFKEEAFDHLIETLERFGISHSLHKVVPFVGTLVPVEGYELEDMESFADPRLAKLKNPVICMGSYSMRHSAKKYGWSPGVFDLMEVGSFQECMKHWGDHMLNADSVVVEFQHANWPSGEERFIRPTNDSKFFAGKLIEADEFLDWQRNVCVLKLDYGNSLTPETLIQVCVPKSIHAEYRLWVVKGKIVTTSLYKRGDRVYYENFDGLKGDQVRQYAEERIAEWQPLEAFVIDVCETELGMKIVEINTLNSCGFYAADIQKLVFALQEGFGTSKS